MIYCIGGLGFQSQGINGDFILNADKMDININWVENKFISNYRGRKSPIRYNQGEGYQLVDNVLVYYSKAGEKVLAKSDTIEPGSRFMHVDDNHVVFRKRFSMIYSKSLELLIKEKCTVKSIAKSNAGRFYIVRNGSVISAKNFKSSVLWSIDFDSISPDNSPGDVILSSDNKKIFVTYQSRHGVAGFVTLDTDTGILINKLPLKGMADSNIFIDKRFIYLDGGDLYKIDHSTGKLIDVLSYVEDLDGPCCKFIETENCLIVMAKEKSRAVVVDKKSFKIIQSLNLGGEEYYCGMVSNGKEVVVGLMDNSVPSMNGPSYMLMLSEEQLISGDIPEHTIEEKGFYFEKEMSGDEEFSIRIKLKPDLSFADVLRFTSHGLAEAAHTYATYQDPFNREHIVLSSEPYFDGNIVLDLSDSDYLFNPEEKEALDYILHDANLTFCDHELVDGTRWAFFGTDRQRNLTITSLIPYER